jgi:hypothetical protein
MSEIIRHKLYLGSVFDADNEDFIKNNNITCIICLADGLKIKYQNVKIYHYNLTENYEYNSPYYFNEIIHIINKEDTILINCFAGVSRSATIAISYVMNYYNLNLHKAFIYVKNRRNTICPNEKFMKCLLEYEQKLFNKNSLTYDECVQLFYYS